MRAGLDRTLPTVSHRSAVQQCASLVVGCLEFYPNVKGVHRAAREEVPDLARSHDDLDADRLASADDGAAALQLVEQCDRYGYGGQVVLRCAEAAGLLAYGNRAVESRLGLLPGCGLLVRWRSLSPDPQDVVRDL